MLTRNVSIFSFSVGCSENKRLLELVWDPGDRFIISIYWKMGKKAVILKERVARFIYYYYFLSENQRHLELVKGPVNRVMSSICSKMGDKDGHLGGARSPLPLILCCVLQPTCGPIVLIGNVSIFFFSVGFSAKQRNLELDWGWKMGKEAVISKERVARSLYYYAKFNSPYAGLLRL